MQEKTFTAEEYAIEAGFVKHEGLWRRPEAIEASKQRNATANATSMWIAAPCSFRAILTPFAQVAE